MAGILRRYEELPSIEVLKEIEGVVIVDEAPADPATGAGSGTVLIVGEFEDGLFAADEGVKGAVEVFGARDYLTKFGAFGYVYNNVVANNPCARRHLGEFWNGNGYLKAYKLRARRILVSRVDTSVGSVSFDPLAALSGGAGPFQLSVGDTLSLIGDLGTASSAAIAASVATVAGSGASFATVVSGESFGVRVDGAAQVTVTFGGADTTQGAVLTRINNTLGYPAVVTATAQNNISGRQRGSGGSLQLVEITPGLLAKLGWTATTASGSGNVANVDGVTVDELVTIINGTSALNTLNLKAEKDFAGVLRVYNSVAASVSTIEVAAGGPIGAKAGFTLGTEVSAADHVGGTIPAGTRVRAASDEWVVMQTITVEAGELGPFVAKVRPALDDGTAVGASAGTVVTLVDQVSWVALRVTNPAALGGALTENQLDNAYAAAMDRTLDDSGAAREANYLLVARRSDAVIRAGKANAIKATECGLFARKYITGDPIGTSTAQILANVALYRHDRVFYVGKGLKVRIPDIAQRGVAGGLGFTADGVITVRPDGPLATLCAILAPEENPGQKTGLIDDFFEVDSGGEVLEIEAYKAFKFNGVAVPRADRVSGMVFQSGVTSSLVSGRTTMARRKMADFIQDTLAELSAPYSKKLSKQSRRDNARTEIEQWLGSLRAEDNPELSRIAAYAVDDGVNAGNTPANVANGFHFIGSTVRTLPSMDVIVHRTSIGPNAVVVSEL